MSSLVIRGAGDDATGVVPLRADFLGIGFPCRFKAETGDAYVRIRVGTGCALPLPTARQVSRILPKSA